ncbi:MAG: sialidase family protein [Nitrososphaera sp.]
MHKGLFYGIVVGAAVAIVVTAIVSLDYLSPVQNTPTILSIQNVSNASNPSISVSETGTVYAAFARTEGNLTNIYLISSSDAGKTFSEPAKVNDIPGDASNMWNTIPVQFGPNGEVYVAWMIMKEHPDFPWGITELRVASSVDVGKTFSPAVNPVPGAPSEKAFFDLAVSQNGALYISYLDSLTNQYEEGKAVAVDYPSSYKMVKSTDGGKTFGDPVILDNQNCVCCQTASAMGPDGEVYFAWRDLQYESNVRTTNTADNPYNYGNANGTLFEGTSPTSYETIRDIVVMHTTDSAGGNAFSKASKVSDDKWYLNGCPDAGPGMAFDRNGRLHVAWFTGSATAPDGLGYYYAYSDDKGQTFSKAVPLLTDEEFIPPTMASVSVDSSDNIWIAFADQRSPEVVRYSAIEEGHPGRVHLVVIDKNQNVLFNDSIASGAIHEFVDISAAGNTAYVAWKDGTDAKFATVSMRT